MKVAARICWAVLATCAALAPHVAAAQAVLGSGCATFPGVFNQQQTVSLNRAAAAGQLIVVSLAVNAQASLANSPGDSSGNSYPINNSVALNGGSAALLAFAGRATTALNVGSTVTIGFSSTGSTTAQSCVSVTAFSGVSAANPDDAYGTNSGTGSSLAVTSSTATLYASELVYSVFASATTPGAITALSLAHGLGQTCSGDATLCLLPAWNLGAATSGILEGADASSANSAAWGALLITFQSNDRIFADGFDGD